MHRYRRREGVVEQLGGTVELVVGRAHRPAYVIGDIRVTNSTTYSDYVPPALASITQYGGKVLAVADNSELLDGGPMPERTVVVEFADAAAARRWYRSPEYQAALPIRLRSSEGRVFLIEGLSG